MGDGGRERMRVALIMVNAGLPVAQLEWVGAKLILPPPQHLSFNFNTLDPLTV